ncbi:MAG: hypothetical protein ACR2FQ_11090 [Pseudonocardiaceae bacterium]
MATVAAGLLAACGSGPSQLGAAAIVGDTTVPLDQVQSQLRFVLEKEGPEAEAQLVQGRQLDDVARQIVTLEVRHELITAAARREGLSVGEQQVTELVDSLGGAEAASAGTIFDAEGFRARARDQLLVVELGRKYLPRLSVTVDFTTVGTRVAAMERVAELAAAGPQGARESIQADAARGTAAAVDQELSALDAPEFASAPVFGVAPDTVVGFPSDVQEGTWLVMVVTDVTTAPPVGGALSGVDPALLEAAGIRRLAPVATDVGVRINPRYGIWDPLSVQAVPNENETAGFVAPLRRPPPV